MKTNHIELINMLMNYEDSLTSTYLSKQLNTSVRTIKNYVTEINTFSTSDKVINSSKSGYKINKQIALDLLNKENKDMPQTHMERAFFIIKLLLINKEKEVDLYELCDMIYISYSTLKLTIAKMNTAFKKFNVEFLCAKDKLRIVGSEKNKRKLMSFVLFEEANNKFIDMSVLKNSFDPLFVDRLSSIITITFKESNFYINDFSYMNLLLHLLILIERVGNGDSVQEQTKIDDVTDEENNILNTLCGLIESSFNITLNKNERSEIIILIKTNVNYAVTSNIKSIQNLVDEEALDLTQLIVKKVEHTYHIDLSNDSFLAPFSLHLKNLLFRLRNQKFIKNPMLDTIKKQCPLIYDIAVYVSFKILKQEGYLISEDEIAYLALHIGAEVERQKANKEKIKTVILCPEYMGMSTTLYNQILLEFNNDLSIVACVSYENDLKNLNFDLLITTICINNSSSFESIVIPPFNVSLNKSEIYAVIDKINSNNKNKILKNYFSNYFSEDIFFKNPEVDNYNDIFKLVSNKMTELEYTTSDFYNQLLERELAASTAFWNIAIPHSVNMDALKTSVAVVISKEGIKWNNNLIHLVLVIAINEFDRNTFRHLYEALIALFSDNEIVNESTRCTNFEEFKNLILSNITTK